MSFHKFRLLIITLISALALASSIQAANACDANTGCYGAIAAGLWRTSSGTARVAAGTANNYASFSEARNAAMRSCNSRGYNCKVIGTFSNGGCGFISVGNSYSGVGWGSGATRSAALNQCRSQGYNCDSPIGGCAGNEPLGD